MKARKTWERILAGSRNVGFKDFETLLAAFSFEHRRTSGSHRIYGHPMATRPLSIQPVRGQAKPYQLRQFLEMVEEFGLTLEDKA
jgi:predicted RNA binding protein YcfA (HicA-like mRNA interferase family)